jgi:hypothetical protein
LSQNIASKLAAVAIAVVMNGIILGGVCYLFAMHSYAGPASAQCPYHVRFVPATIV